MQDASLMIQRGPFKTVIADKQADFPAVLMKFQSPKALHSLTALPQDLSFRFYKVSLVESIGARCAEYFII